MSFLIRFCGKSKFSYIYFVTYIYFCDHGSFLTVVVFGSVYSTSRGLGAPLPEYPASQNKGEALTPQYEFVKENVRVLKTFRPQAGQKRGGHLAPGVHLALGT